MSLSQHCVEYALRSDAVTTTYLIRSDVFRCSVTPESVDMIAIVDDDSLILQEWWAALLLYWLSIIADEGDYRLFQVDRGQVPRVGKAFGVFSLT